MAKLKYFDCNCSVGRTRRPYIYDISDAAGLLREMDTAGVEEALVYHSVARESDPALGNSLLEGEITGHDRLHPVWVVLPHHTGEFPEPRRLLKDMEAHGVRAVKLFPTKDCHGFSLERWCSGELLDALTEARVPVMLDIEVVWWEAIERLLREYTGLPVIVVDSNYRHGRFAYPLFERFETLYVELSRHFGAGVLEDVVRRFGPRPLLFGSNMPRYTGTAAVSFLAYADIPHKDKQAISGDNLRDLLKRAFS